MAVVGLRVAAGICRVKEQLQVNRSMRAEEQMPV
jgi:hypothetical protein